MRNNVTGANLAGRIFGRWTALEEGPRRPRCKGSDRTTRMWWCECSCEAKTRRLVRHSALMQGNSLCCGCVHPWRGPFVNLDGKAGTRG